MAFTMLTWLQGFDVTLLEAGSGPAEEVGVRGKLDVTFSVFF